MQAFPVSSLTRSTLECLVPKGSSACCLAVASHCYCSSNLIFCNNVQMHNASVLDTVTTLGVASGVQITFWPDGTSSKDYTCY